MIDLVKPAEPDLITCPEGTEVAGVMELITPEAGFVNAPKPNPGVCM